MEICLLVLLYCLYLYLQPMSFCSMTSSGYSNEVRAPAAELFNIVSVQSSARPGCIIELEPFTDAEQVWNA